MANPAYSLVTELIPMLLGLKTLETPPAGVTSGNAYWLEPDKSDPKKTKPRSLQWNWDFFNDGKKAWEAVPYRGWIIAQIVQSIGKDNAFIAIPGPVTASVDIPVIGTDISPDNSRMPAYKALTKSDGYLRSFQTKLAFTLTQWSHDGQPLIVLGGGLHSTTQVWKENGDKSQSLRADLEIFAPIYGCRDDLTALQKADTDKMHPGLQSLQIGLQISRQSGALAENLNLSALRFHARVPLRAEPGKDATHFLETGLGQPLITAEKRAPGADTWTEIGPTDWQAYIPLLLKNEDAGQLLKSPIGPITEGQLDPNDTLAIIKGAGKPLYKDVKSDLYKLKDDGKILGQLLWKHKMPNEWDNDEKEWKIPNLTFQSLSGYLKTLGFIEKKGDEWALKDSKELDKLKFWDVLSGWTSLLDGLPIYARSVEAPKAGEEPLEGEPDSRAALQFAFVDDLKKPGKKYFGGRGLAYNIPLYRTPESDQDDDDNTAGTERKHELMFHLGKWLSGETLEDNWVRRLLPMDENEPTRRSGLPGIGLYPVSIQRTGEQTTFRQEWRTELVSFGFDARGLSKNGLLGTPAVNIGGVQIRGLAVVDIDMPERLQRGFGGFAVKLNNVRLLLGLPDESEDLDDDDRLRSRLNYTEKELKALKAGFGFSVGYLFGVGQNKKGSLDFQLWDGDDKPAKAVWIPVDRTLKSGWLVKALGDAGKFGDAVYIKSIGLALKNADRISLDADWSKNKVKLGLLLTGGLRFSQFELGLINAGVLFALKDGTPEFSMDGLDIAFKNDTFNVSGSFLRVHEDEENGKSALTEYAGALRIQLPILTIAAMGAYGRRGDVHTFFIYGAFSAPSGGGIMLSGFARLTGLALGFGLNRRVKIPALEKVAGFSLVKMVMGEGGIQKDYNENDRDNRGELGKPADQPFKILASMREDLYDDPGQYFVCAGIRLSLFENVDCFLLAIVQWGNDLEVSVLGLGRIRLPRTGDKILCFAELQLLATVKPSEGYVKIMAALTDKSWVFSPNCRLTGGFALCVWYGGAHKGDFVVTLGGYHPRFKRPDHFPVVPRLGINWQLSPDIQVKGGLYLAITPSCIMAGGRLEAVFRTPHVSAWFTAYLDVLVEWAPVHYEVDIGIVLRVEADLIIPISLTLGISLSLWGPPLGGVAVVDLVLFSFPIEFGVKRENARPEPIETWEEFAKTYLVKTTKEKETPAARRSLAQPPTSARGASGFTSGPGVIEPSLRKGLIPRPDDAAVNGALWVVRADELELAGSTVIPATELQIGTLKTSDAFLSDETLIGKPLMAPARLPLQPEASLKYKSAQTLGVRPMLKKIQSRLDVAVCREIDGRPETLNLSGWTLEAAVDTKPKALWSPDQAPLSQPGAETLPDCITGIKSLKPPPGRADGNKFGPFPIDHLEPFHAAVRKAAGSTILQNAPGPMTRPDVQAVAQQKRKRRQDLTKTLVARGFILPKPEEKEQFRPLYTSPLQGSVTRGS